MSILKEKVDIIKKATKSMGREWEYDIHGKDWPQSYQITKLFLRAEYLNLISNYLFLHFYKQGLRIIVIILSNNPLG